MAEEEPKREHLFWGKEPVVLEGQRDRQPGQIKEGVLENVRKEPFPLAPGFSWCLVDTTNEGERSELFEFLRQHYVIHPHKTFRFAYSAEFLDWALHCPGWRPEWHLGVRSDQTGALAAFISAIPITVRMGEEILHNVAVDFLSVHQKLRGKKLAPLMIRELTRRVNLCGIFTAVYTAGKAITEPIVRTRYHHRLINYEKLCAIKFTSLPPKEDMKKLAKRYSVPKNPRLPGFRAMVLEDVPAVTAKLNEYLRKFPIAQVFNEEEVTHWFVPRPGIVGSYVIEKKKEVQDFFSFYIVPSNVFTCPEYETYTAAYVFYYFAKPSTLTDIARACIEVAHHQYGADVVNCLDIMDNKELLEVLKFVEGDGMLHYYAYNYWYQLSKPEEMAICLL
jgi:glycylpeptide N-tetradecanoyltransferase